MPYALVTMNGISRRELLTIGAGAVLTLTEHTAASAKAKVGGDATLLSVFRPNDIIVFQGDSITDGGRQRDGMDYNHIMGQDYCYIIAGRVLSELPQYNLTFWNRGDSGNTVMDLAGRWQTDTISLNPTIVSILVGVNDANQALGKVSPADAADAYRQTYDALIQQTLTALPNVRIVLGQPFVLPVGARQANYADWKAQITPMQTASELLAEKYKLPYVRYADMMDQACTRASADHWSWDGIHPTYAGHYLMHTLWLQTVYAYYAGH